MRSILFIFPIFYFAYASSSPLHCAALLVSLEGSLVSAKYDEPEIFRRQYVNDATAKTIRDSFSASDFGRTPELAFEAYLEMRLKDYSQGFKRRVLGILHARIVNLEAKVVMEPHVNHEPFGHPWRNLMLRLRGRSPVQTVMEVSVHPEIAGSALYYSVLAHEFEHVLHFEDARFSRYPSATNSLNRYYKEFGAHRAEWEYWKLVPDSQISLDRETLDGLPRSGDLTALQQKLDHARKNFSDFHAQTIYATPLQVQFIYYLTRDD